MNPYEERRLIDEVIFLHSLWHQGPPPTPPPNPLPIPIPTPAYNCNKSNNIASASEPYVPQPLGPHFHGSPWHLNRHHHQQRTNTANPVPTHPFAPAHTRSLPPASSTTFKKRKKNKNKKNRRRDLDPPRSPGPEWPCPGPPEPPATGWSAPKKPRLEAPPVSPQEKERLAALQAQNKACQAFREFLLGDDDDDDDEEEDDDDDWEEFEGFFVRIFMEDDGLRGYYQRCFENGEFCCLVCGAVGKKNSGKKFKDCVGLLQHSMSILRTLKKRAHRVFGQAVCKVLGWDIDRFPTIVMKGEPLGCSVKIKPSVEEGEAKENADDGKDGPDKPNGEGVSLENNDQPVEEFAQGVDQSTSGGEPKENDDDGKQSPHKQDDKVACLEQGDELAQEHAQGVDQSIIELSSKECVYNKNAGNLDERMLHIGLENEGGTTIDEVSPESLVSGADWVCKNPNADSSSTASVWPTFHAKSSSHTCSLSAEVQANAAVLQMQHKALEACEEYLVGNAGSDHDDDDDNGDEDDIIDYSDPEQCEDSNFFVRLFTEDSDLRRYYENNYREGDFYCLVCGGIGKKMWKRFKDCIALLQHSTAIKRTKRKQAHRAYSQVICKVLGWDIDRLPAIVLKAESHGSSFAGSTRKLSGEPDQPEDTCIDYS